MSYLLSMNAGAKGHRRNTMARPPLRTKKEFKNWRAPSSGPRFKFEPLKMSIFDRLHTLFIYLIICLQAYPMVLTYSVVQTRSTQITRAHSPSKLGESNRTLTECLTTRSVRILIFKFVQRISFFYI